jgi:plastocyanin
MARVVAKVLVAGLALAVAAGTAEAQTAAAKGKVVTVQMVDKSATEYRFEPAVISVQPGDTLRFVTTGAMTHNVEWKVVPAGAKLGDSQVGPYLTAKGQTYDLVIDSRFAPGDYEIVCTPHQTLGMQAKVTIGKGASAKAAGGQ